MKMSRLASDRSHPADSSEQSRRDCRWNNAKGGMARAILERRCATGEITRQQYEELLQELGWDDAKMARIYTRKAAQKKLAASGAAKLSHIIVPPSVPPEEEDRKIKELEGGWCPWPG